MRSIFSGELSKFVKKLKGMAPPVGNVMPLSAAGGATTQTQPIINLPEYPKQKDKPAEITLVLGGREYSAFVDDITKTQDRKNLTLKAFRG